MQLPSLLTVRLPISRRNVLLSENLRVAGEVNLSLLGMYWEPDDIPRLKPPIVV